MMGLAIFFLFTGMGITLSAGWPSFALLLVMSVFGVLYRIHFIPRFLAARIKVSRLKEIPASKTFFVALAWALVVVLLPAVSSGNPQDAKTYALMLLILQLVFVRNALFDVFQVQGDRIVGKETLPVLIGAKKTIQVLHCLMAILLAELAGFSFFGLIVIPVGYFLLPGILYLAGFTYLYSKEYWSPGVKLEFALETTFVIIALSVWAGNALLISL